VLFRLLRHLYGPDHVTYVRNITDVDDKINARALRDFPDLPLNEAIRRVTEKTANQFQADVKALGCLEPTAQPRATEFIDQMIAMISTLIAKENAYQAGGEVLFDVESMKDYGALSNRKLEDQQAGARVAVEAHKKNPGDFVLWKLSSAEEPGWESPWGRGRPGWHIECSAMSKSYLGEIFDIHGGGLDLIFPHHENELAQSRCAHGTKKMANVWMHNGFLQIEGKKMSKTLLIPFIYSYLRHIEAAVPSSVKIYAIIDQGSDLLYNMVCKPAGQRTSWATGKNTVEVTSVRKLPFLVQKSKYIDHRNTNNHPVPRFVVFFGYQLAHDFDAIYLIAVYPCSNQKCWPFFSRAFHNDGHLYFSPGM
jgi:hypothetical protein